MMKIEKDKIRKILIIKLRGIGDVVLSSIVFDNLRNDFPQAEIDFLTERPSNQFLENSGSINKVIIFRKKSLWERLKQIIEIRNEKYDLILDFYSNPATALITFFSSAEYRAGFPYDGRKYAYNIYGPAERGKYHAAQLHIEFLKKLELTHQKEKLHFDITEFDRLFADRFFADNFKTNDFIIGICPSGGWPSKKCDPEIFAEIADVLVSEFKAKILILWGPGDEQDADKIQSAMNNLSVSTPPSSICQMGALIEKCSLLVANDSGPMHISTAVGTPVLSLHGPTSPTLQGPFGRNNEFLRLDNLECIECNLLDCNRNHECFKNLSMEKVVEKVGLLINKNNLIPNEEA